MATTEQELKEAQDRVKELEDDIKETTREKDELKAKIEEADTVAAKAKAQDEIKGLVEKATNLPEAARKKILGQFAESITVEGVKEAIEAEFAYLKELGGKGIIADMGVGESDTGKTDTKIKESLRESRERSYIKQGFSPETAKQMADTYVNL